MMIKLATRNGFRAAKPIAIQASAFSTNERFNHDSSFENLAAKAKTLMNFDYKDVDNLMTESELVVFRDHFRPGYRARIFDFSNFALQDKGLKFVKLSLFASVYGMYYFNYVAANGIFLMGTGISTFFLGTLFMQAKMMNSLQVACITISPCGKNVTILLFNGMVIGCPIADFSLFNVEPKKIQFKTHLKNRVIKIQLDHNTAMTKMYYDPFLVMAIAHPDVHSVSF